mmetsp:Transcript_18713/g.71178  ORF Transcript_18713/g.71178 Transcript_18713/m.71178 type:complete len:228 (+) Transcript_18713:123-806(+)
MAQLRRTRHPQDLFERLAAFPMPSQARVSASTARAGVRIEAMTEARFAGAADVQNEFLGARKALCGVFSYRCCPSSAAEFGERYRTCPDKLATSAVAVREEDDRVVGFAIMTLHGMPQTWDERQLHTLRPGECYLDMLSVAADARGLGIGSKLLHWCEETAIASHAEFLSLGVVAGNPAQRLYERRGFEMMHKTGCCASVWLCCFLGLPHLQCGGFHMEKPLPTAGR